MFVSGYTQDRFTDYRSISPVFLEKPFGAGALLRKTREALRLPPPGADEPAD